METSDGVETLDSLVEFLDRLTDRPSVSELRARLESLRITLDDLAEKVCFSSDHYARNLLRQGEWYHLLVLCWRSGQRSPIHNHAGSVCGLRILEGVATETRFEPSPAGLLRAVESEDLTTGTVAVSRDSFIHQISNLQPPGNDLVTLHLYSPPLLKMEIFSLTDRAPAVWEPLRFDPECVHGGGI